MIFSFTKDAGTHSNFSRPLLNLIIYLLRPPNLLMYPYSVSIHWRLACTLMILNLLVWPISRYIITLKPSISWSSPIPINPLNCSCLHSVSTLPTILFTSSTAAPVLPDFLYTFFIRYIHFDKYPECFGDGRAFFVDFMSKLVRVNRLDNMKIRDCH